MLDLPEKFLPKTPLLDDTFNNLKIINSYIPENGLCKQYDDYYQSWKEQLLYQLQK